MRKKIAVRIRSSIVPMFNARFHPTMPSLALLLILMTVQTLAQEKSVTPNGFPLKSPPLEAPTIQTHEGENITASSIASETGYWIKGKEVYFIDKPIANADPKTFKYFDNSVYAKDKLSVYAREKKLVGADTVSFIPMDMSYAKDSARCYYWHNVISGADPKSFRVLESRESFSRDKLHVFASHSKIENIDPDSFQYLDGGIFTDKNGAYSISGSSTSVELTPLTNVNPKTLAALGWGYFKDNKLVFTMTFDGKLNAIPGADVQSFEVLKSGWARDKSHVYDDGKKVEGVSPIDFNVPDSP